LEKDTDGDGIYDKDVLDVRRCWFKKFNVYTRRIDCKIVLMLVRLFGLASLNGCPDTVAMVLLIKMMLVGHVWFSCIEGYSGYTI
jgi:hypothetical protein